MRVPVVFISFNNNVFFRKSLNSFLRQTSNIYELHVVDNASTDKNHLSYLRSLSKDGVLTLWENRYNQFTFGLNSCLKSFDKSKCKYMVICDSDFLYPDPIDEKCWLTALIEEMDVSPYLGKLGLSISLENIQNRDGLESIVERELGFSSISLNERVWSAQVDTTPAIYRKDLYLWSIFRLYPGHMTGIKSYYHAGRHKKYIGYHLGWDGGDYSFKNFEVNFSKIRSFAIFGGGLDKTILCRLKQPVLAWYYGIRFISKSFWFCYKVFFFLKFHSRYLFSYSNKLLYPKKHLK